MRHNPSRAEIHAHMYGVVNGDIETSTTMTVMAHALNAQLLSNTTFRSLERSEAKRSGRRARRIGLSSGYPITRRLADYDRSS